MDQQAIQAMIDAAVQASRQELQAQLTQAQQDLTAARNQAQQDLTAARNQAQQDLTAARNQITQLTQTQQDLTALQNGSYFSTIDDVWDAIPDKFQLADWEALRRTRVEANRISSYGPIIAGMDINGDPALGSSRSESLDSTIPDVKGMPSKIAQGAHFIPHNKTCAVAFGPVAEMALGQNLKDDGERTKKRHRLVVGVEEARGTGKQKKAGTGLKHSDLNKLRIKGQKEYMDNRPCLLIVPLLSLDETKAWKSGDPYSALLCAGGFDPGDGGAVNLKASSELVYRETLVEFLPCCTREDLELATGLLSAFTKGLAQSLLTGECFDGWETNQPEKTKLRNVQENLNGKIHIPRLRDNIMSRPLRVAKVRFDPADVEFPNPPDPFLLVLKAAIIWSWRNNEKLLPGCYIPEEDEWSEGDELMHEYEERLRQGNIRPSDHLKVARGLGLAVDETTVFKIH
jgi:hypothetical protein